MEKRFKILRFIGSVYKILGAVTAVLTLIGSLAACVISVAGSAFYEAALDEIGMMMGGAVAGVIVAIMGLLWGGIMALMLYGMGEGIFLILALEENTRKTSHLMQQYSAEPVVPEI
jgi:Zn-dependent protease with chaperone function